MENKKPMFFASLNPYLERNIILPTESNIKGQNFVEFGDRNQYPNYIWNLYSSVSTLQSIINGTVDYVLGDGITSKIPTLSDRDAKKLVNDIFSGKEDRGINIKRTREIEKPKLIKIKPKPKLSVQAFDSLQ